MNESCPLTYFIRLLGFSKKTIQTTNFRWKSEVRAQIFIHFLLFNLWDLPWHNGRNFWCYMNKNGYKMAGLGSGLLTSPMTHAIPLIFPRWRQLKVSVRCGIRMSRTLNLLNWNTLNTTWRLRQWPKPFPRLRPVCDHQPIYRSWEARAITAVQGTFYPSIWWNKVTLSLTACVCYNLKREYSQ